MEDVKHQLLILVQLLEKADQARLANRRDLMDYALISMRKLLYRRFPPQLHTLN